MHSQYAPCNRGERMKNYNNTLAVVLHVVPFCYSSGWRPRRTIIFAFWDASKYGQIGAYKWAMVKCHIGYIVLHHITRWLTIIYLSFHGCRSILNILGRIWLDFLHKAQFRNCVQNFHLALGLLSLMFSEDQLPSTAHDLISPHRMLDSFEL